MVYRGSRDVQFVANEYQLGRTIHWSAFSSTSVDPNVARTFATKGGVVFRIQLFSAKDVSPYSIIRAEKVSLYVLVTLPPLF